MHPQRHPELLTGSLVQVPTGRAALGLDGRARMLVLVVVILLIGSQGGF